MKKKNYLTKKMFMLACCIAMMLAIGGNQVFSQPEDGVYFRTVFEAIDSQNNRDTVTFVFKEGATRGIDEHLGEVNLYGVPPQGDLDMRIIQRTAWDGDLTPMAGNIDLKTDFKMTRLMTPMVRVILLMSARICLFLILSKFMLNTILFLFI